MVNTNLRDQQVIKNTNNNLYQVLICSNITEANSIWKNSKSLPNKIVLNTKKHLKI